MAPDWLPSDGSDVEQETAAETEAHVEQEVHVEQDTEVENTLPPRLKRDDPEHKMMPGGHGLRPTGWAPSQRLHGDGGLGMTTALQPQQVQLAVTMLMQGRTISLQYGRYGVFYGLQVETDFGEASRAWSDALTGATTTSGQPPRPGPPPVGQAPTQVPTTEVVSDEEEADPGVPFEHGIAQPGRKPPPQAWFQRQNVQDWMNRMAKQPGGQQMGMAKHMPMPRPPPPGPPPKAAQQHGQPPAAAHGVPQQSQGPMPTQPVPMPAYPA